MIMDETKLAHAAQKGDLDAFNRLVLMYQEMAFNLAYRMLGDTAAAADATQQAFISAYQGLKGYRGGSLRAWIMRIVTNQCYDELRRLKRHPTTRLEQYNPENNEEIETPSWLADNSDDPEDTYSRTELDRAIQHCLDGLSENYRTVVILVDVQGCDYQEAANVIQKPIGTVKSRLARARLSLQECLQQFKELLPAKFRLVSEGSM
jgi:RNA polymerase sigma-70 factor (ECF subfamily)